MGGRPHRSTDLVLLIILVAYSWLLLSRRDTVRKEGMPRVQTPSSQRGRERRAPLEDRLKTSPNFCLTLGDFQNLQDESRHDIRIIFSAQHQRAAGRLTALWTSDCMTENCGLTERSWRSEPTGPVWSLGDGPSCLEFYSDPLRHFYGVKSA